jgi:hypothetical protein
MRSAARVVDQRRPRADVARREPPVVDVERDERAAARPPRAPAVFTDIVPRPLVREVLRLAEVPRRAVARPPLAPAAFFCAVEPARPPFAPALRTVMVLRAVAFRAVVFVFRRAVVLRVVVLRDVVFLRAVVLRALVLRALVLRAVVFRAAVFRVVVFRVVVLRPVVFRADDVFRDDEDVDRDEPLPPDERVSPDAARCLFTVRAAISFARPVDRPCLRSESLMCSYWRSRFALHALGIATYLLCEFPGRPTHARNVHGLCVQTDRVHARALRSGCCVGAVEPPLRSSVTITCAPRGT